MDVTFAAKFLGALFAIMNPFINLPIFLSMVSTKPVAQQRGMAVTILFYTAAMCIVISMFGGYIIAFFGVTIASFRVAGGLVLLGIALSMLNGRPVTSHERGEQEKQADRTAESDTDGDLAFYPMTFPMVVGPGTMATLIVYAAQTHNAAQYASFALVLASVLLALFIVLFFAAEIGELLSAKVRVIMTRIMGMILAAIAVEMVIEGAKVMLPGLA
ncbi:MarC family protein [Labrys sp. 22185]|uniref:MarC family protein n=1 Tax=Labrys sp. 22185 TaxID=3453888 RepID=UPI003F83D561